MRKPIIVGVATAFLAMVACQSPDAPDLGNPLDPSDPNYTPPSTAIATGPEDAATVTEADVTFTWRGSDRVSEYRYQWDDGEWSDWGAATSATLELLDEGEHAFGVAGRYPTGAEQPLPTTRAFVVDAVKGPALMFRPRKVTATVGDTFTVDLMAEEVDDLMLVVTAFCGNNRSSMQPYSVRRDNAKPPFVVGGTFGDAVFNCKATFKASGITQSALDGPGDHNLVPDISVRLSSISQSHLGHVEKEACD